MKIHSVISGEAYFCALTLHELCWWPYTAGELTTLFPSAPSAAATVVSVLPITLAGLKRSYACSVWSKYCAGQNQRHDAYWLSRAPMCVCVTFSRCILLVDCP